MKANRHQFACFWSETGGQYRRWNIIGAFLFRIFYNFAFLPTEMARLIIHVESTALLNWDTANQLGTRVTEVRRRQLEKRGCVVWVWGRGVLGAWPGASDKWWQETALGSLPDLTNWTPGKGVREQLQPSKKTVVDTNFVRIFFVRKFFERIFLLGIEYWNRGGPLFGLNYMIQRAMGINIKGCEKDLRNPRVAWV